jgi:hypothetical protein
LRAAIIAANKEPGKNIITFARDDTDDPFTLSISGTDEDEAATGDLDIRTDVIILGNGADKTTINGGGIDRVFHIQKATPTSPQINVVIQGVTIRGGRNSTIGGGILNGSGKLTLNSSVVRDNLATDFGGGIANSVGAAAEINNSTIGPDNEAFFGGGVVNLGGTLTVNNSTVSGNISTAGGVGGGIYNTTTDSVGGVITITHSTITLNTSPSSLVAGGAGIQNIQGTVNIKNSIVAGNKAERLADCRNHKATYNSLGYNLVGQNGDANGCPTVNTDIILPGAIETAINTTRQGAVPFHALVGGSPAIDAIPLSQENCLPPSYDQHNTARPLDGGGNTPACDIGAIEAEAGLKAPDVVERSCPLDAQAGRIIVEFPEDVVLTTRSKSENSFSPLAVNIPAGTYDITLVSFDDHIEQPQEEDQKHESWFIQAQNEKGDIVFESNPISDLPKAQNILEELVEEHARINKDITGLSARHVLDVGESETAESVGPVCAAFDRVEKDREREDKDKKDKDRKDKDREDK